MVRIQSKNSRLCGKSRRCDKQNHHCGKCNSLKEFHNFWDSSSLVISRKQKAEVEREIDKKRARLSEIGELIFPCLSLLKIYFKTKTLSYYCDCAFHITHIQHISYNEGNEVFKAYKV